jgi:hypothetical protein
VNDDKKGSTCLSFYPNPCNGQFVYLPEKLNISIYDLSGQLQLTTGITDKISVAGLPPGLYVLIDENGRAGKLIVVASGF